MTDVLLDLSSLPLSNPATVESGWSVSVGSSTARINDTGFYATAGTYSGWTSDQTPNDDVNGFVKVELTIASAINLDSYNSRVTLLRADGAGYVVTREPYNIRIHRLPAGGINQTPAQLASKSYGSPPNIGATVGIRYNKTTGAVEAYFNGILELSATDTTYNAGDLKGGFAADGYSNYTGIATATVYNVGAAASMNLGSSLTVNGSINGTCSGLANGAATLSGGGLSIPVTVANNAFSGTVTDFADNITYPLLPTSGTVWTLSQGGTTATDTQNLTIKSGWAAQTLASVSNAARSLGKAFQDSGNSLQIGDQVLYPTAGGLAISDAGIPSFTGSSVSGTLFVRRGDGKIYSHQFSFSAGSSIVRELTARILTADTFSARTLTSREL